MHVTTGGLLDLFRVIFNFLIEYYFPLALCLSKFFMKNFILKLPFSLSLSFPSLFPLLSLSLSLSLSLFLQIDDAVIVKLDEDVVESRLALPYYPEIPEADRNRFKTQ